MPDPGYGPNGERHDPTGRVSWLANAPPEVIPSGDEYLIGWVIGASTIPPIAPLDDEVWAFQYPQGAG